MDHYTRDGLSCLIIGCWLIIFRNFFAKISIKLQNSLWHFKSEDYQIFLTKVFAVMFGIIFIMLGIFAFFHLIKVK